MDDSNTIKIFTAADIEKYHKGLLSGKQMHDLEKAALDDPFLADALEGYTTPGVNAVTDITELKQRLVEKTEDAKVVPMKAVGGQRKFPWLRAAAVVLVVAGAGILGQKMFTSNKNTGIAKADEPEKTKTENVVAVLTDTISSPAANGLVSTESDTKTFYLKTADSASNSIASNKTNQQVNTGEAGTVAPGSFAATEEKKTESDAIKSRQKDNNAVAGAEAKVKPAAPVTVATTAPGKAGTDKWYNNSATDSAKWAGDIAKEDASNPRLMRLPKKEVADKDKDGIPDQYEREKTKQANGAVANNTNANAGALYKNSNQPANMFRGRVTDANNVGLPFARVMNPADNNAGTYTDVRGYFTITYPDSAVNVQVRSIGFDDHNIQLRSTLASNQVTMLEDKSIAAEVVSTKKPNAERRRDANMKLVEPEPIDGWDNYDTYIANNLEMPEEFKTKPAFSNGSVEVSFEVNKYGEPVNIKVEKSLCNKCDAEAIRLVKEGPKFRRNANKHGRTTVTISF